MFAKHLKSQSISLAAIYQSCFIVSESAWHGRCNEKDLNVLVNSLFIVNPLTIKDVYEDTKKLATGLELLKKELSGENNNKEIKNYYHSLINLSNKLKENIVIANKIEKELLSFKNHLSNENLNLDQITIKLSEIYTDTLSKIEPRIIVNGDNTYLKDIAFSSKIRTALFTGLRSVFLWKQFGGSKLKNFFYRSKIIDEINKIINF